MPNHFKFRLSGIHTNCTLLAVFCLLLVFGTWYPLTAWDWSAGGVRQFLAMDIFDNMSPLDTIINLVIYMPFGFLVWRLLAGFASGRIIITTVLGCLFATMLEMGQTFLPGRYTSLSDIVLNATGTLLGALVAMEWQRRHWGLIKR